MPYFAAVTKSYADRWSRAAHNAVRLSQIALNRLHEAVNRDFCRLIADRMDCHLKTALVSQQNHLL